MLSRVLSIFCWPRIKDWTALSISGKKTGEKTVVGVSKMAGGSDKGLSLIISGKFVK